MGNPPGQRSYQMYLPLPKAVLNQPSENLPIILKDLVDGYKRKIGFSKVLSSKLVYEIRPVLVLEVDKAPNRDFIVSVYDEPVRRIL